MCAEDGGDCDLYCGEESGLLLLVCCEDVYDVCWCEVEVEWEKRGIWCWLVEWGLGWGLGIWLGLGWGLGPVMQVGVRGSYG